VVCRGFLAPKYIDPKFLDPKHVFKDLSLSVEPTKILNADKSQANVFYPEKKRRHREGYADGDYTLYTTLPASSFIRGNDPISALGGTNRITFLSQEEKE
jgi:AdoMet-dependent rRNA methyltransferase SPB1